MSLSEIKKIENGAKFYRADLHIHSKGDLASYDVTDDEMTPRRIIDEAIKEGISIISITDHNEVGNIPEAIDYSKDKNILFIPGIELSTSQGHLLVYFETYERVRSFLGELSISTDKKQCDTTITSALELARKYYGFGIAAHIDIDSGFETYSAGYTPFKEAILKHDLLYGLEISNKASTTWYTELDENPDRKRLFRNRRKSLNEDNSYNIAKIMSSDAHKLSSLGKNLSGNKKLTKLKLDNLNFNSFRVAFLDANSRVRIEEEIPSSFPKFIGIEFNGGILDSRAIHFSDNFNSLIGGRGTGKSTILESLRAASGNKTRADIIDNEVWPDTIKLYYQDESGQLIELYKEKLKDNINITDPTNGITTITIESFGQGETASTIQKCGENPEILLEFIDNFIETTSYSIKDEEIRTELLSNQTLLERIKLEIDRVPTIQKALKNAQNQLIMLKQNKAKDVVELEEGIATERVIRSDLDTNLEQHIQNINEGLDTKQLKESFTSIDESVLKVGKVEFKAVSTLMNTYIDGISKKSQEVVEDSGELKNKLKTEIDKWKKKEIEAIKRIELKRKELESKGVKLDISFIRKVTRDVSEYDAKLKELKLKEKQYRELRKKRVELLEERKENLEELYKERYKFIYNVNANLKGTVVEYEVDFKIEQQNLSEELSEIIKSTMGWRTIQVQKADFIVDQISYFDFLKSLKKNDASPFLSVKSLNGQTIFKTTEVNEILMKLNDMNVMGQLERVIIKDKPLITIKKVITNDSGSTKVLERDFSKLSMGQQQSILLTLLLYSKRNCPLIIDQPEDNLDSEFIYKTLVKNLKKIKEHRQVIIVTHNANIAVLGDSELIIPLKSSNEKTFIIDRGSIDNPKTNRMACNILEGGEAAFKKRQDIYNI
jgi:hypothetical protein